MHAMSGDGRISMAERDSDDLRLLVSVPRSVRGVDAACSMVVGVADASGSGAGASVESIEVSAGRSGRVFTLGRELKPAAAAAAFAASAPPSAGDEAAQQLGRAVAAGGVHVTFQASARDIGASAAAGDIMTLDVRATVVSDGRVRTLEQTCEVRVSQAVEGLAGWTVGDAHVHTTFSDAIFPWVTPHWQADRAAAAGLDWIVLTDHADQLPEDEYTRQREKSEAAQAASGVTVVVGEEIGQADGHYLALGAGGYLPSARPADAVRATKEKGGFGYVAHPFHSSRWDFSVEGFSGLEIATAWPTCAPDDRALARLDRQAAARRGWAVMSNGDDHLGVGLGGNATWVFTGGETSAAAVIAGLRAGRTAAGNGPLLAFTAAGVGIGGTLGIHAGTEVPLVAEWPSGYEFDRLVVTVNGRRSEHEVTEEENAAHSASVPAEFAADGYVRLEGYGADEDFVVTSPVFVNIGGGRSAKARADKAVRPA
ncbi:MAG TPA: CehA/McbA family metallohydrolase [Coriobacteriia bacterium]